MLRLHRRGRSGAGLRCFGLHRREAGAALPLGAAFDASAFIGTDAAEAAAFDASASSARAPREQRPSMLRPSSARQGPSVEPETEISALELAVLALLDAADLHDVFGRLEGPVSPCGNP
jgi:hypothetical protein